MQSQDLKSHDVEPYPVLEDVSIVIPTLGRPILKKSLDWIADGSAWPKKLVIVDQSSSEQVAAWITDLRSRGINAEHLPSSQKGKAAALNRGIEQVTTRFVLVTDDDCFVDHCWVEKMATLLGQLPQAIITGPAEPVGQEKVVSFVADRKPAIYRRPGLKFDTFCGSNMGVAKDVIKRIGPFDEDPHLVAAEDSEWVYRALRTGVPVMFSPDVKVGHYGWRDSGERADRYHFYALSHGGFYGKYLRKGDWFIALRAVIHYLRALRRWLRGALTGDHEAATIGRAYLVGLWPGIIATLRREKNL